MDQLAFRLRVVTPLFLSGAEQQVPELRPPSIRGALRFWFRAMMGAVVGGDWRKVRELETLAFGSTEQASPVQLRCKEENPHWCAADTKVGPLPEGVLYLGFDLFRRGQPYALQRPCLWPQSVNSDQADFQIQFLFHRTEPILKDVILGAFWLLVHCGGLGARVRRGFGGLQLLKPTDGEFPLFQERCPQQDSGRFFRDHLIEIAEAYAKFAKTHGVPADPRGGLTNSAPLPSFSCFARYRGLVLRPSQGAWKNWEDVLAALGQELRGFRLDPNAKSRFGATHDYQVVAPFLDNKLAGVQDLRYDGFGLPIQYRSMSRTKEEQERAVRQGSTKEEAKKLQVRAILQAVGKRGEPLDRRASPLFLRPLQFRDGTYGGLLLFFEAEFLPEGAQEVLRAVRSRWPKSRPMPNDVRVKVADLKVIHDFLDTLKGKPGYKTEEFA